MPDPLDEALERIRKTVMEEESAQELAKTLFSLQKFRTLLSDVINEAHTALFGKMDAREQDFGPGIGVLRRSREVRSTWNHADMLAELKNRAKTVDGETGTVEIDGYELARLVEKCVAFSYWRKTALREENIEFSEYLSEVYGQPRIRFISKEGS